MVTLGNHRPDEVRPRATLPDQRRPIFRTKSLRRGVGNVANRTNFESVHSHEIAKKVASKDGPTARTVTALSSRVMRLRGKSRGGICFFTRFDLLGSERVHRVDAGGSARRNPARQCG